MVLASLTHLLYSRLFTPVDPNNSLSGKTILITGGNSGLGFEAALKYVLLGAASVVIGCRSEQRGQEAKELIEQRTQRLGVVHIWPLDLNDFVSVKAFADRVNENLSRLNTALLNAGVYNREFVVSPQGWEGNLQVNLLSTILLGLLLLPKLKASNDTTNSSQTHLSFVSSGTMRFVKAHDLLVESNLLDYLNNECTFKEMPRYPVSKYLLDCGMREIANLTLKNGRPEVIVNSISPGICRSNLSRQFDKFHERFGKLLFYSVFGRSSEEGGRSLVSATLQGPESHGKVWKDDHYPEYVILIYHLPPPKYKHSNGLELEF